MTYTYPKLLRFVVSM